MGAIQCNWEGGCRNTTWSPDGRCQVHRGKVYSNNVAPSQAQSFATPNLPHDPAYTAERVFQSFRKAFPDTPNRMHPTVVREQVMNSMRAGVSVHAYRVLGDTDVEDFEERKKMLGDQLTNVAFLSTPRKSYLDDAQAEVIATAVDDRFGIGIGDSMELSFYGLHKEWELADAMGVERDENGIEYGDDFNQYAERVKPLFIQESSNQMMRMYKQYPQIIFDLKGRAPLNTTPIFAHQDMTAPASNAGADKPTPEEIERQEAAQRRQEMIDKIDGSISKFVKAVKEDNAQYKRDKSYRAAERQERREERKEKREYREMRNLMALQRDAAKAQIKMERRTRPRKGWF